ncbi:hypothetical protein PR202_ga15855 [Eleusine coracana subsp. coracana]|uniref:Uncharacterized protein n=1 Tax=Eleusine coracana subsp. coracana TaxID=191504 RepID=A0AAV5CLA2_ELECO|nr:hypothetical protein PR202_ga15855 [Eleusine coracana subsp. coracana]
MDAGGIGGDASRGIVRAVVGWSSSPLFFWLLTVALVAAIHASSSLVSSRNDEKEREKRKARSGGGFAVAAAGEEREVAAGRSDDRVLEMMRSFSFVQATEEDFLQGMAAFDHAVAADVDVPEPYVPSPVSSSSFSFKFQHQMPEIPRNSSLDLRELPEEEKVPSEHDGYETEETELVVHEERVQEQRREVVEAAPPKVHNYQFLTERDFRGFVTDPEAMTVRVEESFVPSPPPAAMQLEERRVVHDVVSRGGGGSFLTETDFTPADEPDATESVASSVNKTPSSRTTRKPGASSPSRTCASVASSGKRTPSRARKPAAVSPPPHACESVASSGKRTPPPPSRTWKKLAARSPSVASRGSSAAGGRPSFASEFSGFGDSDSESSASDDGYSVKDLVVDSDSDWFLSEKDFPGSGGARDAGAARRRYEAKVLEAIEALEAAKLEQRSYEEHSATTLSPSSVRQGSPDSIPDGNGSGKYPEDMWSRSPSPDVVYEDDVEKVVAVAEAEEAEEKNVEEEDESVDTSDDELSSSEKKVALAPVHGAASVADRSLDHSEKETITLNDHLGESISDVQTSPEAVFERGFVVSSNQVNGTDVRRSSEPGEAFSDVQRSPEAVSKRGFAVASNEVDGPHARISPEPCEAVSDAQRSAEAASERGLDISSKQVDGPDDRRSSEPSEHELVGTIDHSLDHVGDDRRETASESDQSYEIVFDDRRRPEPVDTGFVGTSDQSHELISDVWKEIVSRNDQPSAVDPDDKGGLDSEDKEFAGSNDHPNELTSVTKKVTFNVTDDQSYAVVSDDKSIPEMQEHNLGCKEEEEQEASANDHSDNFARQTYVSVTGKAKMHDDDGEDPDVKWKDLTDEEEDELESLWEHQDLIEQLKLELKKVRSIGLPTILEESETPKAPMEDLKPWRMDAKFLREDPMDELNKFYKSYRERMRKFDILCYQKMYAIDFLQLRGSKESSSMKSLPPTVASILSHNFRPSRRRSPEDPSERFLKELRYDLETVYVGQMCLSWEFLRWQYEQARDLPESDPYHSHQYNQVAGEFQQFQVVVQRFVEDESFKGPRLPNYINNRCVLRNLLQVPVIKEDSLKDRMEEQRKGNYVITSEVLEEIMEEAMHVMWEFIKADKVETTSVIKSLSNTHVELQDPLDHDLMAQIHAALQKKEKRLKDLLRTGNCLVKKFKKPKEDRSNQNLFFSQVDMRLVARVLRMPRITSDQLQWCKAKMDKIILVDRVKIHREPSFLLFPC